MDTRHEAALRIFNGFLEGKPDLAIDLYARTLVIHNYADQPEQAGGRGLASQGDIVKGTPLGAGGSIKDAQCLPSRRS